MREASETSPKPGGAILMLCCESPIESGDLPDDVGAAVNDTQADGVPVVGLGCSVSAEIDPAEPVDASDSLQEDDADLIDFDASAFAPSTPVSGNFGWVAIGAVSVLIHGGLIVLAVLLVSRLTRPASAEFAYGDTGETYGIRYRAGDPDRTPGWDGLASVVPPRPTGGQPIPPPPTETTDESATQHLPPAAMPVLPESAEERISTQSITDMPLPEFPVTKKFQLAEAETKSEGDAEKPPVPAATQPIAQLPEAPKPAAAQPTEVPATDSSKSAVADASTAADKATTQASASATSANASQSANPAATSGDNTPGGQGGATTGVGGTAVSGMPGIPAGLRDGQRLPAPVYPEISRRRGEQGDVRLEVEVRADGSVGQIRVVSNTGHPRLAEAAVDSLRGFRFRPALASGTPVDSTLVVPFSFHLR